MNLVRCEYKELVDKGVCNKGYFFNPSNWDCECDKSCGIGEYLDYSNCKCRKKLFHKLIEECTENNCNSFKQGDINILDEFAWNV